MFITWDPHIEIKKIHCLTFDLSIHLISLVLIVIQLVVASSSIGATRILPHPHRRPGAEHLVVLTIA